MGRVEGKIAIVTGGGTGIGRATAHRLAEEGARVTVTDVNAIAGRGVADGLGGNAVFVQHDVRWEADW
jgi:NAD(P)-dependent dehydrogenase (short-subunit alcohol dehydrogenase family)